MKRPLPELNKKPGVYYALTPEGVELPIVDVTNPAFVLSITPADQQDRVRAFIEERQRFARLPKIIQNLFLRVMLHGSALGRGIRQSRGSFMSGTDTYLLKLGPEMLGNTYAKPIDRKIAASLPALGVRLRMQDVAQIMSDCLLDRLLSDALRPLHFLNIAGGPAIDSLNALILLNQKAPNALARRTISIEVLDLDDTGPRFGESALQALSEKGAPLHGLRCTFRHIRYNWANHADLHSLLKELLDSNALTICSSEGGLFEYGSDQEILANLRALRASQTVFAVAGSVTRADEATQLLHQPAGAAVICRGLPVFNALLQQTGWRVARVIERPFSDHVLLT